MTTSVNRLRKRHQRFIHCIVIFLLSAFIFSPTNSVEAQARQKVVEGKVVNASNQPQSGAIVYLKNNKSGDIKSFISIADGGYRFGQLSPNIDYDIWAEYQGHKSSTKTVSSFDSKKLLSYALKVDTGK